MRTQVQKAFDTFDIFLQVKKTLQHSQQSEIDWRFLNFFSFGILIWKLNSMKISETNIYCGAVKLLYFPPNVKSSSLFAASPPPRNMKGATSRGSWRPRRRRSRASIPARSRTSGPGYDLPALRAYWRDKWCNQVRGPLTSGCGYVRASDWRIKNIFYQTDEYNTNFQSPDLPSA